jgi:serine/threonine protein phosphatase PrpC
MRRISQLIRHLDEAVISTQSFQLPNNSSLTCVTKPGSNQGKPKTNQDAFHHSNSVVCLCDGHGFGGEVVSKIVSHTLCTSHAGEDDEQRIELAQLEIARQLNHLSLRCGSSAVWVRLLNNETLTVSNVGDSRCLVLGVGSEIIFFTRDHKPDDPVELARIHAMGGKVFQAKHDCARVAGLALSRAFGDFATRGLVMAEPDVTVIETTRVSRVVLCTDGVFDVCTNEEVAELVADDRQGELVDLAVERWKEESNGRYADDITCVVWDFTTTSV